MRGEHPQAVDLVGRRLGVYTLERAIGQSHSAVVFEARTGAGERCAVKVVSARDVGREGSARLFREALLAAHVDTPHVISVFDSGFDSELDVAYLVMPYVAGGTLGELIARVGALEPEVAVRVAIQAARGLAASHASGIVHRDIKPSNLLLADEAGGVVVRVSDFGIAKPMELYDDANLTASGRFLGSPSYMSPEQAKSAARVDERSDIWSLGLTLYEMLTGRTPFADAETLSDLIVWLSTRDAPPVQDTAPWVAPGLAVAVHKALRRNKGERWSTMARFAESLSAFSGGSDSIPRDALVAVSASTKRLRAARADELALAGSGRDPTPGSEHDQILGATVGERYHVERLLSQGGMGSVYAAERDDGVAVALKLIAPSVAREGERAARRFMREARAAAAIDHPNVVRILEASYDERLKAPFIAMELLDGVDCASLFKRSAPLDPVSLARLFAHAAAGVGAAHAAGIVHRDIKPANLFLHVDRASDSLTVKVCDFGIAKLTEHALEAVSQDLTGTGRIVGSPVYMSPEQARNATHVDERSDVWSLCVSLYEGLSGRRPWHGYSALGEVILAICTENPTPLAELAPWVPRDLVAVVERGMRRDPAERWQSVEELRVALELCTEGSLELSRKQLRAVPRRTREAVSADEQPSSTIGGTAHEARHTARRGVRRLVLGLGVAAAVAAWFGLRSSVRDESPATLSPSHAAPAASERSGDIDALLRILPEAASAQVNGRPARRRGPAIVLRGRPGTTFDVELMQGSRRQRFRVVLTSEGSTLPELVELAGEASSAATRAAPPKRATPASAPAPPVSAAPSSDPLRPPPVWK